LFLLHCEHYFHLSEVQSSPESLDTLFGWSSLGAGFNGGVKSSIIFQGELVAAGSFIQSGNTAVSRIAKWNGSSWTALGDGFDNEVIAPAVFNNELIAAGSFAMSGASLVSKIARWNGVTGSLQERHR
jgi:hypothetical protein